MNLPPLAQALEDALSRRTARLAVVGLGYVGLPLAEAFVQAGFTVLGHDTDPDKVHRLGRGESYLGHIAPERIGRLLATGRFRASADPDALAEADALLICVPTPLTADRQPDLSAVLGAAEAVGRRVRPGRLVVLESTSYPGTTREVVRPILERGGLRAGADLWVAFSPEREDPGNLQYTTATIPRVVGGLDEVSGHLAAVLYGAAVRRVVTVSSAEVAEACKLLENTYRAVNIALVNELKILYDRMGIDVWEVIEAARTKPFGFQAFYPGPGWGGHCIPIDPLYLAWAARRVGGEARFVELADAVNRALPGWVVDRLAGALARRGRALAGARVLILGLAYKRDIDDVRESPALEVAHVLKEAGAVVVAHDPHVASVPGLATVALSEATLAAQDAVVIVTDHSAYDWDWVVAHSRLVVDTRNATRGVGEGRERIVRA